ncbi:MAG: thiamine pyrophosphate-dependent enzyme [Methanosarcina barkeri]|nr:thiamine pyrophosphate-dependent enzyme [Methanosarcina sp. ERenArc_MAG2]
MGCSVRSAPEPLAAVDVSFALGSAISVACGFEKKGIAVIGDFALAHSGILGLLSAATTGCSVLVLVLQNEVAAMTGGQEVPDLRKVVEAITPDVSVFDIDADEEKLTDRSGEEKETGYRNEKQIYASKLPELIRAKLALPGLSVIFMKGKCRKY